MTATGKRWLTPTEAAVVSSSSVRNVNRSIDEKILPEGLYRIGQSGVRQLSADACVFISFYFQAANRLISEERLRIIAAASEQLEKGHVETLKKEWTIRQEFLTVDLAPFLRDVMKRLAKLNAARALVVEDPDILSRTPVLRGTRIPVYDVAALATAGEPTDRLLEDYPRLTAKSIELAQLYGEAYPLRGRPRQPASLPAGAVIVAHYRVPSNRTITQKRAS